MDLPVVAIKLRDYLLWFGPAYLLAIAIGAAAEVALRRLLKPTVTIEGPTSNEANLLYNTWLYVAGYPGSPHQVTLSLYLWLEATSRSLSLVSLLVTAALSWPLALIRIGSGLILASLLAASVPALVARRNFECVVSTEEAIGSSSLRNQWWQALKQRFDKTSNSLVLGAVLGAALIGLAPNLYALLNPGLGGPLAYLLGPIIGTLSTLIPGPDIPLVIALQTRGAEGAATGIMLAVIVAPFDLIRQLKGRLGLRATAVYLAVAWSMAAIAAWLLNLIIGIASL